MSAGVFARRDRSSLCDIYQLCIDTNVKGQCFDRKSCQLCSERPNGGLCFRRTIRQALEAADLEHPVDVVVQVATALQWATLAIGDEPQTERAVDIVRVMLAAGRASPSSA